MEHDIILDLLPLYHDGVCSKASRQMVEEHLQTCDICRKALADMDAPIPEAKQKTADDAAAVKKISQEWKKGKWKARLKGGIIAALICVVLFGSWYGLTQWHIRNVPMERIEVTNVRQLSDGRLLFHMFVDDEYDLREVRYIYDQEGNWYIVPRRPVVKEKRWGTSGHLWDKDYIIDVAEHNEWSAKHGDGVQVTKVWVGHGEDAILLWEEGMTLPAASAADETAWSCEPGSAAY